MIRWILDKIIVKALVCIMLAFAGLLLLPYFLWKAGAGIRRKRKLNR